MSEGHFHVHGAHEHEVEHQAQSGDLFAGRIAVTTAILATVGAIISYQGSATQNDALLFKNEAAIKKTEASDQWNFYQAKSNKQNMAELDATLTTGEAAERYRAESKRYNGREEGHPEESRRAGARRCRSQQPERSFDACPPSLGAVDDVDPGVDRAGGHCVAHPQEMAAMGRVWDGRRRRRPRGVRATHR